MVDFKKQGKRNRINGANFERRVRADLEKNGWIVAKWQNNVDFGFEIELLCGKKVFMNVNDIKKHLKNDKRMPGDNSKKIGKCVQAKSNRFFMRSTGFPDFIRYSSCGKNKFVVDFVECKTNGYLDKTEKEKAKWYLDNNYCSKFLIASKTKVGRNIVVKYTEVAK